MWGNSNSMGSAFPSPARLIGLLIVYDPCLTNSLCASLGFLVYVGGILIFLADAAAKHFLLQICNVGNNKMSYLCSLLHCITQCIIVFNHIWRTDYLFRKQLSVSLLPTFMEQKWSKILSKVDCLRIQSSSMKPLIQQSIMSMVNLQEIQVVISAREILNHYNIDNMLFYWLTAITQVCQSICLCLSWSSLTLYFDYYC